MAQNAEALSKFFHAERLPCCAEVVSGYAGWTTGDALPKGTVLNVLYLLRQPAVKLSDSLGHRFTEAVTFNKCRFSLLPHDPMFDNKMYLRVADVMRLEKKPRFLRALQGYAYDSGGDGQEGELSQGQILQVSNHVISKGDQHMAVWYLISEDASAVVPVHLPLNVEGHFTTTLDDGTYKLSDLIGNSLQKKFFWNLPIRVSVIDDAKNMADPEKIFTIEGLSEQQWLVMSDGERLFRVLPSLNITLKPTAMSEGDLCSPMQLLAERVNHDDMEKIGPPPAVSLDAVTGTRPVLPPRARRSRGGMASTNNREDSDGDSYSYIYSYVELGKLRRPRAPAGARPTSVRDPFLDGVPPPPGQDEPLTSELGGHPPPPSETSPSSEERVMATSRQRSSDRLPPATPPRPRRQTPDQPRTFSSGTHSDTVPGNLQESPQQVRYVEKLPNPKGKPESPRTKRRRPLPLLLHGEQTSPSSDHLTLELNEAEAARKKVEDLKLRCFKLEKEKAALQREVDRFQAGARASHSHISCEQLCRLLSSNGLEQYAQAFSAEEVDGSLLALLDDDMLAVSLGVTNKLHRLKIRQILKTSS